MRSCCSCGCAVRMPLCCSVLLQLLQSYSAKEVGPCKALIQFEGCQTVLCGVAVLLKLKQAEGSVGETGTCSLWMRCLVNTTQASGELASCKCEITRFCIPHCILLMKQALGCVTGHSLHATVSELLQCEPIFRQISESSVCRGS